MEEASLSQRDASVLRCLGRFCEHQGLERALRPELAEAFVAGGLRGRAPWTKGTYRSALRRMAGAGRPALAAPFRGSPAKAPYGAEERAELLSVAASQRLAVAAGVGAYVLGPRHRGRAASRRAGGRNGDDVMDQTRGVSVRVGGAGGRTVPVSAMYAKTLARQVKHVGPGYLFCPGGADRAYKNFVNNFCYSLDADPAAPRLSSGRARSSFICDHLAAGTPLRALLYISGVPRSSHCCVTPATSRGHLLPKPSYGRGYAKVSQGRPVPASSLGADRGGISFCTEVIDSSGVAEEIERLIKKRTGRPRR